MNKQRIAAGTLTVTVALAVALAGDIARAQVNGTESDAEIETLKRRVDQFFGNLTDSAIGPEYAVRDLVGKGPLKDRNDDINKLIEQASGLPQRYGEYTGHEAVGQKAAGKDLVFLRYLYKGEKFPVVWYFTFYRTGPSGSLTRTWQLIGMRFDTKVDGLEK
ncbi:MAG TPA: hypothetical protein VFV87_17495 [Pirellulaceae bacterium]|nr:hypothetical protein [Pirellulaceae bacterium]